jgi:hypothetical protein
MIESCLTNDFREDTGSLQNYRKLVGSNFRDVVIALLETMNLSQPMIKTDEDGDKYLDNLSVTNWRLADRTQCPSAPLFSACRRPTLFAQYRWTDEWFLCRIRSIDVDGSYTIVWEDGSLQIGTQSQSIRRMTPELLREMEPTIEFFQHNQWELMTIRSRTAVSMIWLVAWINRLLKKILSPWNTTIDASPSSSRMDVPERNGMTVWEAAKRGDLSTTLAIIDTGWATPNDVELLDQHRQGRTPLYWACFGGHVELVRELLARGGKDSDGAAYLAVTTREKADDNRDLLFDPDTGTYSDWVDYPIDQTDAIRHAHGRRDDATLIRAMLVAAQSHTSNRSERIRQILPRQLYKSTAGPVVVVSDMNHSSSSVSASACVICWTHPADAIPVPCGHISCCWTCLTKVTKTHNHHRGGGECPICREYIAAIVPYRLAE